MPSLPPEIAPALSMAARVEVPIPLNVPVIWPVLVLFTSAVSAETPKPFPPVAETPIAEMRPAFLTVAVVAWMPFVSPVMTPVLVLLMVASLPLIPIPPVMVPSLLTVAPVPNTTPKPSPVTVAPAWIL